MNGVQGGGVRINNKQIKDEAYRLVDEDLLDGRLVLLAAGKKNKLLLHVIWVPIAQDFCFPHKYCVDSCKRSSIEHLCTWFLGRRYSFVYRRVVTFWLSISGDYGSIANLSYPAGQEQSLTTGFKLSNALGPENIGGDSRLASHRRGNSELYSHICEASCEPTMMSTLLRVTLTWWRTLDAR